MMIDSDWRWLVGGMALLVVYLVGSAATEMGTRRFGWGRSAPRGSSHPGDRSPSTPAKPKKNS